MALPLSPLQGTREYNNRKSRYGNLDNISPAMIIEDSCTFCSKVFNINSINDVTELQDFCQFKTEIDAFPKKSSNQCYMKTELFYKDSNEINYHDMLISKVII